MFNAMERCLGCIRRCSVEILSQHDLFDLPENPLENPLVNDAGDIPKLKHCTH